MKKLLIFLAALSAFGQKVNYRTDIRLAPFTWDKTDTIWKPGGITGDTNLVRFSGYEGPPTWPALDSPYVFGRKITTSSDIGNFKNTVSIIQHSLFSLGTPAALYVEHRSDLGASYGSTAIYGRYYKQPANSDISMGIHGEVFCDDCAGAAIGMNSEVSIQTDSVKTPEFYGQVIQSALWNSVTTLNHKAVGQKIIMQYPPGGTNPWGGIWIDVGSGQHAYGLKISHSPSYGSIFDKAIIADGDIDLNTDNFLITSRPSASAYSTAGLKFNVDGSTLATIGVENDGYISLSSGLLSRGDVTVNTGQRLNFNRASGAAVTTAGVNFQVDGSSRAVLGVDNSNYVTASVGLNAGTNTLSNISVGGSNGASIYCSDCDTPSSQGAACTAAGDHAGAMAMRVRGSWRCY